MIAEKVRQAPSKGEKLSEKERVLNATKKFLDRLAEEEERGLRYAVVGGMALIAHTGVTYDPIRSNGSKRDIDIIVLEDPHNIMPKLQQDITGGVFGATIDMPPVSIDTLEVEGGPPPNNLITRFFLRSLEKTKDGGLALRYRDVKKRLPPEVMKPIHTSLSAGQCTFSVSTLPPMTLPFLYVTRVVGGIKPKDRAKLLEFMELLYKTYTPAEFQNEVLRRQVFLDFAQEITRQYPLLAKIGRGFHWIDLNLFKGLLSGGTVIPPGQYTNTGR